MLNVMPANETMVMHDMRNMLTVIQLQLSKLERTQSNKTASIFEELNKSIDRAASFASSKVVYDTNNAQEIQSSTRLLDIVDELKSSIPDLHNGRFNFKTRVSDDIMIKGNPNQIYRILFNIIYNAVVALRNAPNPEIKIAATTVGEEVSIAIMDNGPGMPKDVVELLQPSLNVSGRTNRRIGLGISIAASLSKTLKGYLELSKTDKSGTTFIVTLPCTAKILAFPGNPKAKKTVEYA